MTGDAVRADTAAAGWRGLLGPDLRPITAGLVLVEMTAGVQTLMMTTLMPRALRDLGDISLYGLVFSGYLLSGIVSIPQMSATADRTGPARPLLIGALIFGAGSIASALAPTMALLAVARFVQGYGGAAMYALAYSVVPRLYPSALRPKMLSVLTGVWVVAGLAGPGSGALLAATVGWRWGLLAALPTLVAGYGLLLRQVWALGGQNPQSRLHPLWPVLLLCGAAFLLYGLAAGGTSVLLVPVGLAAGIVAVRRIVPSGHRDGSWGITLVLSFLINATFFTTDSYLPLMLTAVSGTSLAVAGIAVTCSSATWFPGSWWQQRVANSLSPRAQAVRATALLVGGEILVMAGLVGAPLIVVMAGGVAQGCGMGAVSNTVLLASMEAGESGGSASAVSTRFLLGRLGLVLGSGLGGAAIAIAAHARWGVRPGVTGALGVALVAAVLAFVTAWRLPRVTPVPAVEGGP